MISHLYILHHASEPRFKIGKADSPIDRARTLGIAGNLDLDRSHQLALPKKRAFEVERFLHRTLAGSLFPMLPADGYTEWFNADAYDRAMRYLRFIADDDNVPIQPINLKIKRAKCKEPVAVKKKRCTKTRAIRFEQEATRYFLAFVEDCHDLLFVLQRDEITLIGFQGDAGVDAERLRHWFRGYSDTDILDVSHKDFQHGRNFRIGLSREGRYGSSALTRYQLIESQTTGAVAGYISLSEKRPNEARLQGRFRGFLLQWMWQRGVQEVDRNSLKGSQFWQFYSACRERSNKQGAPWFASNFSLVMSL